ncbi:MAG: leucine-rich repeat domain-containing protein, partial [Gemmatimonadetes bacterium]|nr:leucine-rich repeat domain-containing protein [Gemmatimonadota bacterium]
MRNLILFTLFTLAFLIHPLFFPAQNSFSFSIEANTAAGDQAITSVNVSPDFDGDGMVGFSDFLAFAGLFGASQGDGRYDAKYDLDRDGAIGFSDFLIFSASFGKEVSPPDGATQVAIPDASLRAVIADSLGKASDAPITQAEMATLTHLAARNKNIRDLTGLEFAINLTALDLEGEGVGVDGEWVNSNEISNLSPLSNLIRLERLYLSGNSISDVAPLSNLTNLEALWLDVNSISNVAPLSNLTRLKGLELSFNSISSVAPLSNLTSLRSLTLADNSISNVSALSGLTRLEWLDLSFNSISNVAPLSNLTSLIELDLSYNSISSVAPLSNLTRLEWLGLDNNSISDLAPLVANAGLGEGDWIEVSNNPLSATSINTHIP